MPRRMDATSSLTSGHEDGAGPRRALLVRHLSESSQAPDLEPLRLAARFETCARALRREGAPLAGLLALELARGLGALDKQARLGQRDRETLNAALDGLRAHIEAGLDPHPPARDASASATTEAPPRAHLPMALLDEIRCWRRAPLLCAHAVNPLADDARPMVAVRGGRLQDVDGPPRVPPLGAFARRERARFQQGLLVWLRGGQDAALAVLRQVVASIISLAEQDHAGWRDHALSRAAFWQLCGRWLQGIGGSGGEHEPPRVVVEVVLRLIDGELQVMAGMPGYFRRQTPPGVFKTLLACVERLGPVGAVGHDAWSALWQRYTLGHRFVRVPILDGESARARAMARHEIAAARRAAAGGRLSPERLDDLADAMLLLGLPRLCWRIRDLQLGHADGGSDAGLSTDESWLQRLLEDLDDVEHEPASSSTPAEPLDAAAPKVDTAPGASSASLSERLHATATRSLPAHALRLDIEIGAVPPRPAGSAERPVDRDGQTWDPDPQALLQQALAVICTWLERGSPGITRRAGRDLPLVEMRVRECAGAIQASVLYRGVACNADSLSQLSRVARDAGAMLLHRAAAGVGTAWHELIVLLPKPPRLLELLPVRAGGRWIELGVAGLELHPAGRLAQDCPALVSTLGSISTSGHVAHGPAAAVVACALADGVAHRWVEAVGDLHRDLVWPASLPLALDPGLIGVCAVPDGSRPVFDLRLALSADRPSASARRPSPL
ncbi:MAG: hypothetical protein KDK91_01035 [Gammaproteobacteria bacterium]|nr:hypothetical protein [Gammaproteobacteria bacterium]